MATLYNRVHHVSVLVLMRAFGQEQRMGMLDVDRIDPLAITFDMYAFDRVPAESSSLQHVNMYGLNKFITSSASVLEVNRERVHRRPASEERARQKTSIEHKVDFAARREGSWRTVPTHRELYQMRPTHTPTTHRARHLPVR